jgi:hypothetical protein
MVYGPARFMGPLPYAYIEFYCKRLENQCYLHSVTISYTRNNL